MRLLLLGALVSFLTLCSAHSSFAQTPPCSAPIGLRAAADYSMQTDGLALVVYRCGGVVLQEYAQGSSEDTPFRLASLTKNLWALLALAAQADGLIHLDERVSTHIAEWRATDKKNITVRQLLSMTSGIDPGFKSLYLRRPNNMPIVAIQLPAVEAPGNSFTYGPANMEVFGELLKRVLKSRSSTPMLYLQQRLFAPLGVTYREWKTDKSGNYAMSGGAKMTAPNLLRLGQLIRNKGAWQGQQIIPAALFDFALLGTSANPMYGATFWLNGNARFGTSYEVAVEEALVQDIPFRDWGGACLAKNAPPDMISMIGSGNQRLYAIPSLDLVIARFGNGNTFNDGTFFRQLLRP